MISVILPALNEELGIEACLRSISEQSSPEDYEVVVVDGGSQDRTPSIAYELADAPGWTDPELPEGILALEHFMRYCGIAQWPPIQTAL